MITVPTSTGSPIPAAPTPPRPDDAFLMMAAAQMHSEGRLVQSLYGEPDTTGAPNTNQKPTNLPSEPPPKEPERYYPSNGRRDKPAMMTENDETKGDFSKGNDTGYELTGPQKGDATMYIQRRDKVDTFEFDGSAKDSGFHDDLNSFIRSNKLKPGDVVRDKDGKYWMHTPEDQDVPQFMQVQPKKSSRDLIS